MTSAPPAAPAPGPMSIGGRRVRDRHGRGARGPMISAGGRLRWPSARERFDALVVAAVSDLETLITGRWQDRLGLVEYAVEDAPVLPEDWEGAHVPLSALVRGSGTKPTRLVIFRRPIEHRADSKPDLAALVHLVLIEQLAELLGTSPDQIDPRYERD